MKNDTDEKLSGQLHEMQAFYHQQTQTIDELSNLLKEDSDSIEFISDAPLWSHLYELPFEIFLAICILEFDASSIVHKLAHADDRLQALIESYKEIPSLLAKEKTLSGVDTSIRFSIVMASINQFSSISTHGTSLNNLVKKAREGNDEALFDAVMIDKTIVSAPSIAKRIQKAQISGETKFLDKLLKAISESKPRRPRPDKYYNNFRYMLVVIEEQIGIDNIKRKNLLKLMEEDLNIYPKGSDTVDLRSFEQFIKRFREKYRT